MYETAARVARDLEENHVRDRDAERPAPSEMAEKLRRARSAGFHDFEPEPHAPDPSAVEHPPEPRQPSEPLAEKTRVPDDRDAGGGAGSLQASMRLDSIERRLFDLRAALDELAAGQPDTPLASRESTLAAVITRFGVTAGRARTISKVRAGHGQRGCGHPTPAFAPGRG